MIAHKAEISLLERRLRAARYYVHKLIVHKYTINVLNGVMSLEQADAAYDEAMKNYDGVILCADSGNSEAVMEKQMAEGSSAIHEAVKAYG